MTEEWLEDWTEKERLERREKIEKEKVEEQKEEKRCRLMPIHMKETYSTKDKFNTIKTSEVSLVVDVDIYDIKEIEMLREFSARLKRVVARRGV